MRTRAILPILRSLRSGIVLLFLLCGVYAHAEGSPHYRVVTTIFPVYDWVRTLVGDRTNAVDIVLLQSNGADLHNYTPSAADLKTLSACDLFVHIGGDSDAWVPNALSVVPNPRRTKIALLDALKHDSSANHEHAHHEHAHEHAPHEHSASPDEHIWLSPSHAHSSCSLLLDALSAMDPAGKAHYQQTAAPYLQSLAQLRDDFHEAVQQAPCKTILVADRFPFRALAEECGLTAYAAFPGCSAECHASFKTIVSLAQKVDTLHLHTIYTLEQPSHSLADSIVKAAKTRPIRILQLNSMQSITADDIAAGASYLSIMSHNLDALKAGLTPQP